MNSENPAIPALCPHCGDSDIAYKSKAALWECQACEERFAGPAPEVGVRRLSDRAARPKAIFFSYGHDENKELVLLFKSDLEKRGHRVWFDVERIGVWDDWKGKITQGIHDSQMAVAFISMHSIRDPGVCRNEIAIAMNRFGTVYPVLLEAGIERDIPVTISKLQWPDFSDWKSIRDGNRPGVDWGRWYEEKLLNIVEKIESDATRFADETRVLREALQPASFEAKIAQHVPGFIGRDWLFDACRQWVDDQPESRLFWIKAGPGVGKSAIAANLADRERGAVIASWFCDAKSSELSDPNKALKSIAFQLALRWDDYRVKLLRALELYASATDETCDGVRKELAKKNTQDLFLFLLAEPIANLIAREHKQIVVIDALDEATDEQGENRITELISKELSSLPEWIGFVVTSRPEAEVVNRLGGFKPFAIDAEDSRNIADLHAWYRQHLGRRPELNALPDAEQQRIEDLLIERSGGMILYLKVVEEGFREGSLTVAGIKQLESGLPGLYRRYYDSFQQRFGNDYEESVKPLLRLLFAAGGPLPEDLACEVLGWNSEQFLACRNRIGSYAIETGLGYELFHKTLGEWLDDKSSGPFHLDRALGRQMLADVLFREVGDKESHLVRWRTSIQEWLPAWLPELHQYDDASSLNSLARVLLDSSTVLSATRPIIERAVAIREKTCGPQHLDTAECLDTLGDVLEDAEYVLGDDGSSVESDPVLIESLRRRVLKIQEESLGREHRDVGDSLAKLGNRVRERECYAEAEPLYRRALAIAENTGELEQIIPNRLNLLAMTVEKLGDCSAAETMYRQALGMIESEGPRWTNFSNRLADFLCRRGRYDEAESLYRRSLTIEDGLFGLRQVNEDGASRWRRSSTIPKLIKLLEAKGDTNAIWELRFRQLERLEQDLGIDDKEVMTSMQNFAVSLRNAGRLEEAEPLQRQAMTRFVRVHGEDSLEAAATYSALGALLKLKGELPEAETHYRKALAIRERELGPDDEKTLLIRQRLKDLYTAGIV